MREILFKAKRLDNGEWVEGNLFWQMYDGVTTLCIQKEPINANDYGDIIGDWYMVDPETVCQYTGLTDKNGVKIFEGDRLADKYGDAGVVKFGWSYGTFGFFCDGTVDDIQDKDLLVIGNIHDKEEQIC